MKRGGGTGHFWGAVSRSLAWLVGARMEWGRGCEGRLGLDPLGGGHLGPQLHSAGPGELVADFDMAVSPRELGTAGLPGSMAVAQGTYSRTRGTSFGARFRKGLSKK